VAGYLATLAVLSRTILILLKEAGVLRSLRLRENTIQSKMFPSGGYLRARMLGIDKSQFSRLVSTRFRFTDKETGEATICELDVSHPLQGDEVWASGVRISPLESEWRAICGVDAYQSLQLSFQYIDHILDFYRSEYDIEPWFEEP
jgi:hypothetical protein